jgi:hypothetical protein
VPSLVDVEDYKRLMRDTRTLPPAVRRDFKKRLKAAGEIGARAARAKILAMPAHTGQTGRHLRGTHPRGLRRTLAGNIRVSVTGNNVRIIQGSKGLTGRNAANLPKDIDKGDRFTHPVFETGRLNTFLQQHPGAGHRQTRRGAAARGIRHRRTPQVRQLGYAYFKKEIGEVKRDDIEREVARVLDDIRQHLTRVV